MDVITEWLQQHTGRIILLVIVMAVAMIATRVLARITNEVLERASIPNASIFANILRVLIWAAAITIVLQPVFGINPTTPAGRARRRRRRDLPGYAGYDREHHQRVRAHARQGDPARRPGAHPRHHRRGQGHHLAADRHPRTRRQSDGPSPTRCSTRRPWRSSHRHPKAMCRCRSRWPPAAT